jgi:hypothetical protein
MGWPPPRPAKGPVHFGIEYRVNRTIDFAFTVQSIASMARADAVYGRG